MEFPAEQWEAALERRVTYAQAARGKRWSQQPWRQGLPRIVRWTKTTREVVAQTFWDDDLRVLLPEQVSTRIWRYGYFEEDVCRYLLRLLRPGDTFVDVGAHYGFFTRLAARLVTESGRALAFEPTPRTYAQLQKNTRDLPQVQTFAVAAYNQTQSLTLYDFGIEYAAYNSAVGLREADAEAARQTPRQPFTAQARRADDVLNEQQAQVNLIKIDVESAELHVLEGLQTTLQQMRPAVILEVGDFALPGAPATAQLTERMAELAYQPYVCQAGRFIRLPISDKMNEEKIAPGNWLFWPQEKAPRW